MNEAHATIDIVRLQSAAPEMLAALEACLLRDDIANDELGDLIRTAIGKAIGN